MTRSTDTFESIALIEVSSDGFLAWEDRRIRCALGRSGISIAKREGDGATPAGTFPLRTLWYRQDRFAHPATGLECVAIQPADGWCDDPADPAYNRPIKLPYPGRHEHLYRLDGVYDLVVPLGYNDDPVISGKGSAIFLHVARPDFGPTEGCVALASDDLLVLLARCDLRTRLRIA